MSETFDEKKVRVPYFKKCNFFFERNRHDRLGLIHCKHRSFCHYYHFTQEEYKNLGERGGEFVDCPMCKGSGVQQITMYGTSSSAASERRCGSCDGKKRVPLYKTLTEKASSRNWCSCPKETEVQYYADGGHPKCKKHCWLCLECNGFTQIG